MNGLLDDLFEVLDGARRYETYIASLCPFHSDHRPSLMVYDDYYRCLACGAHGSTKSLLDKIKGNPPKPKLTSWHNPFTTWLRDQSLNKIMTSAWRFLKDNPCYGNYLVRRGIPIDKQIKLGLGWRDGWHTFPITNEGHSLCGAVIRCGEGLDLPAKYVNPSGQDPNLLYVPDWDIINRHNDIYLTFGIIDAISLTLYDAPGMSTTTGKRLNPEALDSFRKRIIFLPDRDEESDALKIANKLGWRGAVPKMYYPDDCKDINDLLVKHPEMLKAQFVKGKKNYA
jgi:hypothetical protein